MRVAGQSVPVEKFRNRIEASSRATVFAVVQGNDEPGETLCFADDIRLSNSCRFVCPTSVAAASGHAKKASRIEAGPGAAGAAPDFRSGSFVSSINFTGRSVHTP